MKIKLLNPNEYSEEIKAFKTAKYIEDKVNLADSFFDDYESYTPEEIAECVEYLGGDKYYYEIDDDEAKRVLSKPYEQMNRLEVEIWFLLTEQQRPEGDDGTYIAEKTDELLKNQKFFKYRKDKINVHDFYYFYPADESGDYWKENTPKELIDDFKEQTLSVLRNCIDKYFPIIVDTFD